MVLGQTSSNYKVGVLRLQRVRLLPGDEFLPQLHLPSLLGTATEWYGGQISIESTGDNLKLFHHPPGVHIIFRSITDRLVNKDLVDRLLIGEVLLPKGFDARHWYYDAALVHPSHGRNLLVLRVVTFGVDILEELNIVRIDRARVDVDANVVESKVVGLAHTFAIVRQ